MLAGDRLRWLIVLLLLAAGVAMGSLAALPFASVRGWVDQFASDGSAEPYTRDLHDRFQIALAAGCVMCIMLAGASSLSRSAGDRYRAIQSDARDLSFRTCALTHHLGIGLILVTVLAAVLRLPFLTQPMRFDESYTYLNYASQPLVVLLATYQDPNNHVFHSVLVHVTTRLVSEEPWAIRLPAYAAGVLLVPATMLLARAATGRTAAWFAGLLTAASSPLIEFSTNARGYTLLTLLTVLAWLLGTSVVRRENQLAWWLLGCVLALGAWTIPVMVYPAAMLILWIALMGVRSEGARRRQIWMGLLVTIAVSGGLTLLMYAPILLVSGPGSLTDNRFVASLTWIQYVLGSRQSALDAGQLLMRDLAAPSIIALGIGLLVGIVPRRSRLLPAIATIVACVLLTAIQRVLPPARVWLFLVPLGMVVVSDGFARMSEALTGIRRQAVVALLVTLTVAFPAVICLRSGSILQSDETGVCPDARQIVEYLAPTMRPGEPILAVVPASAPLVYYADRVGIPRDHFAPLESRTMSSGPAVVVVSRVQEQSVENVLDALHAPAEMQSDQFEPAARFPSAIVYRRRVAAGN